MFSDIQEHLYRSILVVGSLLSIISIIGNLLASFPFYTNIKWIILLVVTCLAYFAEKTKKNPYGMMFIFFLFLICVFLPFAFIQSGGSNNNAIGYVFLLLIAITYLFSGWKRYCLVVLLIIIFMALHALEYYRPEMIATYSELNQFTDRMIQIPIILLISFFIIYRFSSEYGRLYKKMELLVNYDELTGLYNRRKFNNEINEAIKKANESAYLALIDLDDFKVINDTYGHCAGDEVLKELSLLLQENIHLKNDIVCRWGGDEFAIIYYGGKKELACKLKKIEETFIEHISHFGVKTGFSTSLTSISNYEDAKMVLIDADKFLYREKQWKKAKGQRKKICEEEIEN